MGRIFRHKSSRNLYIAYFHRGVEHRESCGSPRTADARRLLKERLAAVETRRFIPEEQRVTVASLLDAVETHLATRGAKALTSFTCHLKPVRKYFKGIRAIEVTSAQAEQYIAHRLAAGRARATINRELGGLKQAFHLAVKQARLTRAPYLPWLHQDNARRKVVLPFSFSAIRAVTSSMGTSPESRKQPKLVTRALRSRIFLPAGSTTDLRAL